MTNENNQSIDLNFDEIKEIVGIDFLETYLKHDIKEVALQKVNLCLDIVKQINETNLNKKLNQNDIFFINDILLNCNHIQKIIITYNQFEDTEKTDGLNHLLEDIIKSIDSAIEHRVSSDFDLREIPDLEEKIPNNSQSQNPFYFLLGIAVATIIFCLMVALFLVTDSYKSVQGIDYQNTLSVPDLIIEESYEK